MHYAAASGACNVTKWFLDRGIAADIKEHGTLKTPMHLASRNGSKAVALLLLEPRGSHWLVNARDKNGSTPLHEACWQQEFPMIEVLIRNGADVRAKDRAGYNPIERASLGNREELLKYMRKFKLLPLDFDCQFEQSHPRDNRPNKPPIAFKPQIVEPKQKRQIVFNRHSDMGAPTTEVPVPNLDMASTSEIAAMMTSNPRSSAKLARANSGPSLSSRGGVLLSVEVGSLLDR